MTRAIFLSYASQDADAAKRICGALRAQGLEVWFDQSELRGGDAWDASIRKQIKECALFIPLISANTDAREEGYFRLEWKLAVDRTHLMADNKAFLVPVLLEGCNEATALVPDKFRERQWSRIANDDAANAFATRVAKLVDGRAVPGKTASNTAPVLEVGPPSNPVAPAKAGAQVRSLSPVHANLDPGRSLPSSAVVGGRDDGFEAGATTGSATATRKTLWIVALAIIGSLLIAAATLYYKQSPSPSAPTAETIPSLAVLPFQLKGNDADAEYLGEGLAESLIHRLSQLPNLKVSPTSSAFRFKGSDVDPIKAGNDLNVRAVMSGRIVQRGDSLSISVELVDVRNNAALWGEKYERKLSELLATQRDIAADIAKKLQPKLTGEAEKVLAKRYTESNEAYQLYLQGRFQYAKRNKENLERAIKFYEQAIALDNNFALAYVGLADTYNSAIFNRHRTPDEALPLARAAVQRALAIDAGLAEAHSAEAVMAVWAWRWEDAERGFKRAIGLKPDAAEIRTAYSLFYLLPQSRQEEAITELKLAVALDPVSVNTSAALARAYRYANQPERALEQARKAHALDPSHPIGRAWLVAALIDSDKTDEALALIEATKSGQGGTEILAPLAHAKAGRREAALQQLKLQDAQAANYSTTFVWAYVYSVLGNRDAAFAALERSLVAREILVIYLNVEPNYAALKSDPRFAAMLKRMGLAK